MAVAEKTTADQITARDPRQVLMIHSALGALYVLAGLWLVFLGLPTLWRIIDLAGMSNEFLADSLLFLVALPTIFGLFVLGRFLEGPNPVRGLRAGVFYLCFSVIVFGLIIASGSNLWSVIGLVLLAGSIVFFLQPKCSEWMVRWEENGWFHAVSFKPNQGLRVRRSTVIAVMVLVLCGIYTLIQHNMLRTGAAWRVAKPFAEDVWQEATNPLVVTIPFGTAQMVFMYQITLTIPVLILIVCGWLAWRLVNWPTFADFLIATEAEMNKVSWTTRKRLYQDTVVVLTTVVLFTIFLFVIDILWIKILTNPIVDVLKHDPQAAARKNQSGAQW
ncbi:MAG TPA: preprotein translocase subunit SecE [Gemmataceae bacterium]|nr:preprotein translocase subunit SecE [Gemmataceae bacterium]